MLKMQKPFIISSRLLPALLIGDATLSLETFERGEGRFADRQRAVFILDVPEGPGQQAFEYVDRELHSGVGGFRGIVNVFDSFLGFLEYAVEAYGDHHAVHDGEPPFPAHVIQWAQDNLNEIGSVRWDICDERGSPMEGLVTQENAA